MTPADLPVAPEADHDSSPLTPPPIGDTERFPVLTSAVPDRGQAIPGAANRVQDRQPATGGNQTSQNASASQLNSPPADGQAQPLQPVDSRTSLPSARQQNPNDSAGAGQSAATVAVSPGSELGAQFTLPPIADPGVFWPFNGQGAERGEATAGPGNRTQDRQPAPGSNKISKNASLPQPDGAKGDSAVKPPTAAETPAPLPKISQPIPTVPGRVVQPDGSAETTDNLVLSATQQPPASHAAGGSSRPGDSRPEELPQPPPQPETAPAAIQSARVLERMGQSELRVGVNTAGFGNLELRASISENRVTASVVTAHSDLRAAMIAEMPSLQHAMEQHQLRLDRFDLNPHTGSQDQRGSAEPQPKANRHQPSDLPGLRATQVAALEETSLAPSWTASAGINVHA